MRRWAAMPRWLGPGAALLGLGSLGYALGGGPLPARFFVIAAAASVLAAGGCYRAGRGREAVAGLAGAALLGWAALVVGLRVLLRVPGGRAPYEVLAAAPPLVAGLLVLAAATGVQTPAAGRVRAALGWLRITWSAGGSGAGSTRSGVLDPARMAIPDIVLGRRVGAGSPPVVWPSLDRYRQAILFGPPGTGKTSAILSPAILQDVEAMRAGRRLGVTVVEPKGDLAAAVAAAARRMGIPVVHIDPTRPDSATFNPLVGDPLTVAESVRSVLRAML